MHSSQKMLAGLAVALAFASAAHAADRTVMQPLKDAVAAATAAGKLDGSVKFYMAGTGPKGTVLKANVVANRKTNAVNKSDPEACEWVAQSVLISLQEAAKNAGANAVINIVSYYKKVENRNATDYECHSGTLMAGVALRGDLAKVK